MTNDRSSRFPHPNQASPEGIVAVGASPDVDLLVDAYSNGIFPWPHDDTPLLWFSPDPRYVILPQDARVPKSLRKTMRKTKFRVRADTRFEEVMRACASTPRPGQGGTWIQEDLIEGFVALHQRGHAHSIEVFDEDDLVGGFYGVSFGAAFFGESMFARAADASKMAFATFVAHAFSSWGFHFVDCQVHTEHLERFGGVHIPREDYLELLGEAQEHENRKGPWELDLAPADAVAYYQRATT